MVVDEALCILDWGTGSWIGNFTHSISASPIYVLIAQLGILVTIVTGGFRFGPVGGVGARILHTNVRL